MPRLTLKAHLFLAATCAATAAASAPTQPHAPYRGPDYSGSYTCTGQDDHEGPYQGQVTLQLVRSQSTGVHAAYDFKLEVAGYGAYPGHAAGSGAELAIYFANTDPATQDFGTGLARFHKTAQGKWQFKKFYYEPAFKGGNFGFETCTQR